MIDATESRGLGATDPEKLSGGRSFPMTMTRRPRTRQRTPPVSEPAQSGSTPAPGEPLEYGAGGSPGPAADGGEEGTTRATRRAVLAATVPALGGCLGVRAPTAELHSPVQEGTDARLGFVGDVMLGRSVDDRWSGRDPSGVWGPLGERLRGLDGLFLNLECCLSTGGEASPGKTFLFRADPEWAVPALETAGTTWASLANNHVLDFGERALRDTRESLSAADIGHAGAGPDRESALAPSLVEAGPLDVAAVGLTDRYGEYGATEAQPGTAYLPLDPDRAETRATVRRVLQRARADDPDLLVVSLHWGPNWERYPRETHREFGRWLIEQGVDLVHGHSAHVVQGIERYRGRPILYDTGDFLDDYLVKPALRNDRSFLFVLEITDGEFEAVRLQPVEIDDETVRPADTVAAAWLRNEMRTRCEPFGTPLRRDGRDLVVPLDS